MSTEQADFQVTVEPISDIARSFRAEVPRAAYDKQFERAARQMAQKIELKGFRPGKVPIPYVKQVFGERIHSDVVDTFFRNALQHAVASHSLEIVGIEEVHAEFAKTGEEKTGEESAGKPNGSDGDVHFTARLAILPRPEIKNFKGLTYSVENAEPSADGVEQAIQELQDQRTSLEPIEDRTEIQQGDAVFVSYTMEADGVLLADEQGKTVLEDSCLIGKGKWIPELEEAVTGMTIGSEKSVDVAHAEDYADPRRAGKNVTYHVTVKMMMLPKPPVIDDAFAKTTGLGDTVEEMRATVEARVARNTARNNENRHRRALLETLLENNPFDVPQIMIDEEIRHLLFEHGYLDPKDKASYDFPLDSVREHFAAEAEFRAKRGVLMRQVADQEGLEKLSNEDIEGWFAAEAELAGLTPDRLKSHFDYPKKRDQAERSARFDKVMKFLRENMKASEKVVAK